MVRTFSIVHRVFAGNSAFTYMLSARKGCCAYINNGDTAYVHNDHYVFIDDLLSIAATYFSGLALSYLQ